MKAEDKDTAGTRRMDWFLIKAALVLILFVLGEGEAAPKQWATSCTFIFTRLVVPLS
jgi:hypothetical protein